MLSRAKVTPGSVTYYTNEVAGGLEDYYAGRGEAPGHWVGSGSASASLVGEVTAEQLARLFEGCHPDTGEMLGAPYKVPEGVDRVTGWDLTFSAPKSVSVLWAVGGGDIGMAVREAHDAAVAAGLAYLEEHAAFSRSGKGGIRHVDTDRFVAAAFVHRSSRVGDPQLHTHVLVSGRVRCDDGVWRALDSRALHRELKTAGMIYQAGLRAELTERLRVEWDPVDRHGQAEITGVPDGIRRHYSTRRADIEARAARDIANSEVTLGRSLNAAERRRAFEIAVLATRPAKDHETLSADGLHDRWRADAEAAGFPEHRWVPATVYRLTVNETLDASLIASQSLAELSRSASTWSRTHLVREVARSLPSTAATAETTCRQIETVTDLALADAGVVQLAAPGLELPTELRRRDGRSVYEAHGATRFSTRQTLAQEQSVVDVALAGRGAGRGVAHTAAVELAIDCWGLGDDQAVAVRDIATSGDVVSCLVGPAGAGKSRAVGAAAQAWAESGVPVRGLAVSATAAGVLRTETGMASDTVAKFLYESARLRDPESPYRMRPGEVVVVDEAGMLASADLARVVGLAQQAEAKVVLVGDYRQLGAVEAGGLFGLLSREQSNELSEVRRFRAEWEQKATLRLRAGDTDVIELYAQRGRVLGGERHEMVDEAFSRWRAARAAGESVVVCAPDRSTVDAFCLRARAALVASGEVEADGIAVNRHVIGVGDEILTARNDRSLVTTGGGFVRNGDRWRVIGRDEHHNLAVEDLGGRGRLVLPANYVANDVTLAYAVTVHKAQGVTVDRAVMLVDERTSAESLYVGITRGQQSNLALATRDQSDDLIQPSPPPSAADVLKGAMARRTAERSALEVLTSAFAASESLATLGPRLANVETWITQESPPDRSAELERARAQRSASERVLRPGHLTSEGRRDRKRLADLGIRVTALEVGEGLRHEWLTEHADVFEYRDQLAIAVNERRHELGMNATVTQPDYLTDRLGPVPKDEVSRDIWATKASRIEAYREEWGVTPARLDEMPIDGIQLEAYSNWQDIVAIDREFRDFVPHASTREVGLELGIEL